MLRPKDLYYDENRNKKRIQRLERDNIKREIEAILFKTRKILSLEKLNKISPNISAKETLELTRELILEYKKLNSALEIVELSNKRFELKVKDPILNSIEKFTLGDFMRKNDIKTLAVIAHYHPSATRKKVRATLKSSSMYNSIKNLKKFNFIKENDGKIILTSFFFDYFQLKSDNELVLHIKE